MGWGFVRYVVDGEEEIEKVETDHLQIAYVRVLNYTECNTEWEDGVARDVNVCTFQEGVGTCFVSYYPTVIITSWAKKIMMNNQR